MQDGKIFLSRPRSFAAFAFAVALSGCGGGAGPIDVADLPSGMVKTSFPRPHDYPVHGIDVSKFQGDIDWNAVAGSGVKFAWIKATEGGDRADERFQANWTGAKTAGVPRGAYHFVYWCRPPMEEMTFFEQNAPVEDDALPPVLDVEATPTSKTCHRHLTQESAAVDMRVMLQEMERHYGKRPIIYTTVDFYEAILSGRRPSPTIRSGSGPPNTILRSSMDRERGRSGNISPTGRRPVSMDIIPVLPLTQGEIDGIRETFVARLLDGDGVAGLPREAAAATRDEYARRSTAGGMPVALRRPPGPSRSRWFANYVDLVVDKDVMDISRVRQREMLPRLLGQLAARSGQVLNITPVAGAIGLERSTAENYIKLLEAVFLIHRLPAWGTTLGSRVVKHPKVHVVDSGVMAWLLNLTPQKIAQAAPSTLTEYGHLLETFAVGEILKQASWSDAPVAAGYFRTEAGDEVDLVLERDDGQVIAFEIKAGTRVSGDDLRGLRLLKDRLGPRLEEAVVLYTGEYAYRNDGWIQITPLSQLWTKSMAFPSL